MADLPPLAWLDATGLHLPDYPAILERVQTRFRAIYGDDLYLEADSQDGQLAAAFADAINEAYAVAAAVYNSFGPTTAQGVTLSRQIAINGMTRGKATYSMVDLVLVGAVGTTIERAVAKDAADQSWLIPTVTIPLSGQVTVTATAEKPGAIFAPAGDVSKMATPLLGWHSVTNPLPAVAGSPIESDALVRRRQKKSTAIPSRAVFDGIEGAVANLIGVTRSKGYENDQHVADANGLPPHSICQVVEGGDTVQIAETIAIKKTPGCGTYGDVSNTVSDRYGTPIAIRFFRPVIVPIYVKVTLQPRPGYVSITGTQIRDNVVKAINDLGIGEGVLLSKLYTPINDAEPDLPARTFDVLSIELGTAAGVLSAANIPITFKQAASATIAAVIVNAEVAP